MDKTGWLTILTGGGIAAFVSIITPFLQARATRTTTRLAERKLELELQAAEQQRDADLRAREKAVHAEEVAFLRQQLADCKESLKAERARKR